MESELNLFILEYLEKRLPQQEFESVKQSLSIRDKFTFKCQRIQQTYDEFINESGRTWNSFDNMGYEAKTKLKDLLSDIPGNIDIPVKALSLKRRRNQLFIQKNLAFFKDRHHEAEHFFSKFRRNKTVHGQTTINVWAFDKSGKFVITGGDDSKVKVWLISNGTLQGDLLYHRSFITDLAVSQWNRYVASSDNTGVVWIWNIKELALVKAIDENVRKLQCTFKDINNLRIEESYSESGKYQQLLMWAASSGYIFVYDLEELQDNFEIPSEQKTKPQEKNFKQYEFDAGAYTKHKRRATKIATITHIPEKNLIFAGNFSGGISVFSTKEPINTKQHVTFNCLSKCVHLLHHSRDRQYIFAGAAGSGGILLRVPTQEQMLDLFSLSVSTNGLSEQKMKKYEVYNFKEYQKNKIISTDSFCWSRSGKYLVVSGCFIKTNWEVSFHLLIFAL